jgi:hypothetical protein
MQEYFFAARYLRSCDKQAIQEVDNPIFLNGYYSDFAPSSVKTWGDYV